MKANKIKAALLIGAMLHAACFGIYVLLVAWVSGGTIEAGEGRALAAAFGCVWLLFFQILPFEVFELREQITDRLFEIAVSDDE